MHTATTVSVSPERSDIPSMLATLCSYEAWFGPYHPQTLCLMAQVAFAYRQAGHTELALPLLERAARDLGRYLGRDHHLRLEAITILRDLFIAERDYERAKAVQTELLECQIERLGSDHRDTLRTRADLAMILMNQIPCHTREV